LLGALLQTLTQWITTVIGGYGVFAVFSLMTLESTGIPIPSEAVQPFAGYLVSAGSMSFLAAVVAGVGGNMAGSWIAYLIGLKGGRHLWLRYGRYVGIREKSLQRAETWFERYGEVTVFVSRMLPVVRTFISFPPGAARMNLAKFSFYTFIGCVPWVFILTYLGYTLGSNWETVGNYLHYLDYAVALMILAGIVFLYRRWRSLKE
jgi:membrane protein DedA with SNARE-associated domain